MQNPKLGLLPICYTSQAQKQEIIKSDGHGKVSSLVLDSLTRLVSWLTVLVIGLAVLILIIRKVR